MNTIERYAKTKLQKDKQLKQLPPWQTLDSLEHMAETLILPRGLIVEDLRRFFQNTENCGSSLVKVTDHEYRADNPLAPQKSEKFQRHTCHKGKYCKICSNADTNRRKHHISENAPQGNIVVYHAVFTHENTENLYHAIAQHKTAWRNFQRIGQKDRGHEYSKIIAGVRSIEVKRGSSSGLWHVHLHTLLWAWNTPEGRLDYSIYDPRKKAAIIADVRRKYSRKATKKELEAAILNRDENGYAISKLSSDWLKAGGGRNVQCDPVFFTGCKSSKPLESAIYETLKYALKTAEFNGEATFESDESAGIDLITGLDALRGVRQVDYLGSLRTRKTPEQKRLEEKQKKQVVALREYRKKEYEKFDTRTAEVSESTAKDGIFDLYPMLKRAVMADRARAACDYKRKRNSITGDKTQWEAGHSRLQVMRAREAQLDMKEIMASINRAAFLSMEQTREIVPATEDEARQRDWYAVRQYEKRIEAINAKRLEAVEQQTIRELEALQWAKRNSRRSVEIATYGVQQCLL